MAGGRLAGVHCVAEWLSGGKAQAAGVQMDTRSPVPLAPPLSGKDGGVVESA